MSKYELSMVSAYVQNWDYKDAIREIIQNAIDQSVDDDGYDISYHRSDSCLIISTKDGVLKRNSLLLGNTTKINSEDTIGQFGEGYKLALLVLSRDGKRTMIENAGAEEIWTPAIVKSRKWGDNILTVDVKKSNVFKKHKFSNSGVSFIIQDISVDEYIEIVERTLQLQDDVEKIETPMGDILLSERNKGKLYVGGLFIRDIGDYKYGYNILPKFLKLGRDRDLTNDYDVDTVLSIMLLSIQESHSDLYIDLLNGDTRENRCIRPYYVVGSYTEYNYFKASEDRKELSKRYIDSLENEYGKDFLVLTSDEINDGYTEWKDNYEKIGYKIIIKNEEIVELVREDKEYLTKIQNARDGFLEYDNDFSKIIKQYYHSRIRESMDYITREEVDEYMDELIKCVNKHNEELTQSVLHQFDTPQDTIGLPF